MFKPDGPAGQLKALPSLAVTPAAPPKATRPTVTTLPIVSPVPTPGVSVTVGLKNRLIAVIIPVIHQGQLPLGSTKFINPGAPIHADPKFHRRPSGNSGVARLSSRYATRCQHCPLEASGPTRRVARRARARVGGTARLHAMRPGGGRYGGWLPLATKAR